MAQSLGASGLSIGRALELAREVEAELARRGAAEIEVSALYALAEQVLREGEGPAAVRRFQDWRRLDSLDRPLLVMIGGTTGVGKSTLATMLAAHLGITRVIATDVIRQVLRAFFTQEAMPSVHGSAFEVGGIDGFRDQALRVATGIDAIVARELSEHRPLVLEGVHVAPGALDPGLRERCLCVEALVTVTDESLHRAHFSLRRSEGRPARRYLERFAQIRELQRHLIERAEQTGVAVIDNANVDEALAQLMDLVLGAVRTEVI
jgi:2-phosphoglycerate kinase